MLTPADLQRKVTLRLEETETVWLLQLAGGCVNQETPEGKVVSAANTRCAGAALTQEHAGCSSRPALAAACAHLSWGVAVAAV